LNSLNDGLAYALEARDFENFQGMLNKALVLENRRVMMKRMRKLVHQHQSDISSRLCVVTSTTGLCSVLLSQNLSRGRRQLDRDSLPHSVKLINAPTISKLLLLGIRVFKGPMCPRPVAR
jgi:hypothetical protein